MTGKLIESWVINAFTDVPLPTDTDLRGHWVAMYVDRSVYKRLGFGVSPFH